MSFSLAPRGEVPTQSVEPALLEAWRGLAAQRAAQHKYFGCDYLYSAISINSNGLVHPCCYVVAPGDAVGDAGEPVGHLRNAPVLRTARSALAAVAMGAPGPCAPTCPAPPAP